VEFLLAVAKGGLTVLSRTTYDSILLLLTAETEEERDELTKQWRAHKLEELNFVGVVGALLLGCLTSTGSWPTILPNGRSAPWTAQTC
jgi:cytochrome c biogenesis protein CcdA